MVDWADSHRGVYAISVAAELCGLHPQTLRVYEREGLVEPDRTAGGTRLYSPENVARLREIGSLTNAGINIAGVKRVLELQAEINRLQALVADLDGETSVILRRAAPRSESRSGRAPPGHR